MDHPVVTVLLATCQSARFLEEQLESLLDQDYPNLRILIRDGGSTDETCDIAVTYARQYSKGITFLGSSPTGARENFALLMESAAARKDCRHFMFCDHDDVWMKDKISVSMEKCGKLENGFGAPMPVLVYSDAVVTDENLSILDESSFHYQHLSPECGTLRGELLQNRPFGNTMLFNRELLELALPVPREAVMHDHWLAMTALSFGQVGFIDRPTLLYRQHGSNRNRTPDFNPIHLGRRFLLERTFLRDKIHDYCRQADAFARRFGEKLPLADRRTLQCLAAIPEAGFLRRRLLLLQSGAGKDGPLRTLGLYLIV